MSRLTVASFAAATLVALAATSFSHAADGPASRPVSEFDARVQPLLEKYCYECHGDGMDSGDLAMDDYKSLAEMRKDVKVWQKVLQYARTRTMPPPKADQPTDEEREQLVESLHRELYQIDPANPDPGRITVRRLNRSEYRNTIRDLIGVSFDPTIDFPQDDTGYGFDNIADVLTLPPMLMEKYFAATERILDEAIPSKKLVKQDRVVQATDAQFSFNMTPDREQDGWIWLSSTDEDALTIPAQSAAMADYVVRVLAYAEYDEPPPVGKPDHEPVKLSLMLGDSVARELSVSADKSAPQWYEGRVSVPAGQHTFRLASRRIRGPVADRTISHGRIGVEQDGRIFIKEVRVVGPASGAVRRIPAGRLRLNKSTGGEQDVVPLHSTGDEASTEFEVPAEGKYLFRVQVSSRYAGDEPARVDLRLGDRSLTVADVAAPAGLRRTDAMKELAPRVERGVPQVLEIPLDLPAGKHRFAARFVNDHYDPENPDPNYRDRGLFVHHFELVELAGQTQFQPMVKRMQELFDKHAFDEVGDDAAAEQLAARAVIGDFARRAWRRPVADDEMGRLMRLYTLARENGETGRGSVKHAMKGILVSSSFLFRGESIAVEKQQQPNAAPVKAEPIGELELATRLSYFLWSSTPDDELLDLAERGELRKNLEAQVRRMLASKKAEALVENFAGQWLQFRNLDAVHPDRKLFKTYNDSLRDSMIRETRLFFTHILRQDRSLMDVLTADYTFVNGQLAKHYGLEGEFKGNEFKKVSLEGTPRRGVITQGSVLTLTSNPTRTSPVKRGKWVMENLLASPPPPPPADVPALEDEGRQLKGTLRQRFEQHRESKGCASCHAPLDPIGFGLENFDAVGAWRDKDHGEPVDATSAFVNGPTFTGATELIDLLARTRQKDFYRSVSEAALTFALGRGVEPYDQPAVDRIVRDLQAEEGRFSSLIFGVIDSVPFQMRRTAMRPDTTEARADGITP